MSTWSTNTSSCGSGSAPTTTRCAPPGLDEARLRLYRLAMHIGLVSGPLTLIEGDFPHPGRMREIAEHNLHQALSLLKSAS